MGSTFATPAGAGKQAKVSSRVGQPKAAEGAAAKVGPTYAPGSGGGWSLREVPSLSSDERMASRTTPPGWATVQAKSRSSMGVDGLETEADRFADGAFQRQAGPMPQPRRVAEPQIPESYRPLVNSASHGLDERTRRAMEPQLGMDLGNVRIHTGRDASRQAREMNAEAFTVGSHIVFDEGRYAPGSQGGSRLLAHELAHVEQQASGRATRTVQRQKKKAEDVPAEHRVAVPFKLAVDHAMKPEEVLHEVIRQYLGLTSEAEILAARKRWTVQPDVVVTEHDAQVKYKYVLVTQNSSVYAARLSEAEKKAVNDETDKRFWDTTKYKPGKKLGTSPEDREKAKEWKKIHEDVLTEDSERKLTASKRQEVDDLPKDIKAILFAGDTDAKPLAPEDYDKLLIVARKLMQLSPAQRADYVDRSNAGTTSLDQMEVSIDNFLKQEETRSRQDDAKEETSKPLLGLETLHEEWKQWKHGRNPGGSKMKGEGAGAAAEIEERTRRESTFFADLKRQGFSGTNIFEAVDAFEAAMEKYRLAFREQTVRFALDHIDRYEHMLFMEKRKLERPEGGADIAKGIAGSQASARFAQAKGKDREILELAPSMAMEPEHSMPSPLDKIAAGLAKEAIDLRAQGEAEVTKGSNDSFVGERGIEREKLAGMDAAGVKEYLLGEIATRYEQIKQARAEFAEDPDRIFNLPSLLESSREYQEIGKESIYWMIVQDEVDSNKVKKFFTAIVVTIVALALAALVPGGGLVAGAALAANAGISVFQAYEAWEDYKKGSNDYTLGFLDDKPSFAWVVVAMAAAAIDVGLPVAEVLGKAAGGLRKLEGPLKEFAVDKNAAKLAEKIAKIEELKVVADRLNKEAKALEESEDAWKAARSLPALGATDPYTLLGAVAYKYGKALFKTIRKGVKKYAALSKDAEWIAAMGDLTKMEGAERDAIKTAFEELKQIEQIGTQRKMDEATLEGFADRWIAGRGSEGGFEKKLLDEMKEWKALTPAQTKAKSALAGANAEVVDIYKMKADTLDKLRALAAKPRTPGAAEEIQSLQEDMAYLDPLWRRKSYLTPDELKTLGALKGPAPIGTGRIHVLEEALTSAELEAKNAGLSLYDRLRLAVPSAKAKEQALRGVTADMVGTLRKPASGLHVDHIVSVDEIAGMDGFSKLTWQQQKSIVDMRENLIAMDAAANLSKSNRTWRSWPNALAFYDEATKTRMIGLEDKARGLIQTEIARLRSPVAP